MAAATATKNATHSPAPRFYCSTSWKRRFCVLLVIYPTAAFAFAPFASPLLAGPPQSLPLTTARTKTATVHSLARSGGTSFENNGAEETDGWTADNFPRDRDTLEREIRIATERTRPPSPATFQKRRIDGGLVSFARKQLFCSMLVAMVLQGNRSLQRFLGIGLALHGWICVVVPPLGILAYTRWNKRNYQASTVLSIDVDDNDRTETPYYPFWNRDTLDPSASGHNYPLCLAELWCSAVVGLLVTMIGPGCDRSRYYIGWIMARLGVWSALHQYPEQWWHLQKEVSTRPVSFPVYSMRFCTSLLWTRWMVFLEVARYVAAAGWSWRQMGLLYGSSLTLCLGGTLAAAKIDPERLKQRLESVIDPKVLRSLIRAIVFVQGGKIVWRNFTPVSVALVDWWFHSPILPRLLPSFRRIAWWTCGALTPACHIIAALRLLRIQHTSENALLEHLVDDEKDSVGIDQNKRVDVEAPATANSSVARTATTWRYSRIWRTPRRLSYTLRQWRREISHWLYFGGQVIDQLNRPERYNPELIQHMTPELKQRIKYNPVPENNDRSEWVQLASDEMASRHQANYDAGIMDDSLGIFVQQVFGIGLSYNIDHMAPNGTTSAPVGAEVLQARLAKSACKRVTDLYDTTDLRTELNATTTPAERKRTQRDSRAQTEAEIQSIATTLLDLVPTHTNESLSTLQEVVPQFKRVSSHEYIAISDPGTENKGIFSKLKTTQSQPPIIVQGWFGEAMSNITAKTLNEISGNITNSSTAAVDDIDYLNPGGVPATKNDTSFIEAVIEDRLPSSMGEGNRTSMDRGNSSSTDHDDDPRVILA